MGIFSWQMAEELAAEHMRSIGFTDARRTPAGADGGLDVLSSRAVAQVKYQATPVGGPVIQQLRGAAHGVEHALFYSSGGYTSAGLAAAEAGGVALFTYTDSNEVSAVNAAARAVGENLDELADALANARSALAGVGAWARAFGAVFSEFDPTAYDLDEATLIELVGRSMALQPQLDGMLDAAKQLSCRFNEDGMIGEAPASTLRAASAEVERRIALVEAGVAAIGEPFSSQLQTLQVKRFLELVADD